VALIRETAYESSTQGPHHHVQNVIHRVLLDDVAVLDSRDGYADIGPFPSPTREGQNDEVQALGPVPLAGDAVHPHRQAQERAVSFACFCLDRPHLPQIQIVEPSAAKKSGTIRIAHTEDVDDLMRQQDRDRLRNRLPRAQILQANKAIIGSRPLRSTHEFSQQVSVTVFCVADISQA
jgi:hypothetical protein